MDAVVSIDGDIVHFPALSTEEATLVPGTVVTPAATTSSAAVVVYPRELDLDPGISLEPLSRMFDVAVIKCCGEI